MENLPLLAEYQKRHFVSRHLVEGRPGLHYSLEYSALALFRMGTAGSASFHSVRNAW